MNPPDDMIRRFSSRSGRLSHVFLKDRLKGARTYRRIAGYFRSSIFELGVRPRIRFSLRFDLAF